MSLNRIHGRIVDTDDLRLSQLVIHSWHSQVTKIKHHFIQKQCGIILPLPIHQVNCSFYTFELCRKLELDYIIIEIIIVRFSLSVCLYLCMYPPITLCADRWSA